MKNIFLSTKQNKSYIKDYINISFYLTKIFKMKLNIYKFNIIIFKTMNI